LSIRLRLSILFLLCLISQFVLGVDGGHDGLLYLARLLGAAAGVFAVSGVFPITYWAIRRFREKSANGVILVWFILAAIFVYYQCYGTTF
jgi:hypothetical protein